MAPAGEVLAKDYLALEAKRQHLELAHWEAIEGIQCQRTLEEHRRSFSVSLLDRRLQRQAQEKERVHQRNEVIREHASTYQRQAESRLSLQEQVSGGLVMPGHLGQRLRCSRETFVKQVESMSSQYHLVVEQQIRQDIKAAREDSEHCQARQRELLQAACRQDQLLQELATEQQRVQDERCKLYALDVEVQERHKTLRGQLEAQWHAQVSEPPATAVSRREAAADTSGADMALRGGAVGSKHPAYGAEPRPSAQRTVGSKSPSPDSASMVAVVGKHTQSAHSQLAASAPTLGAIDSGCGQSGTLSFDLGEPAVRSFCGHSREDFLPQGLRSAAESRQQFVPAKGSRQFEVYQRLQAYELEMKADLRVLDSMPKPPPPLEFHPVGIGSCAHLSSVFDQNVPPPVVVVGSSPMPVPPPPRRSAAVERADASWDDLRKGSVGSQAETVPWPPLQLEQQRWQQEQQLQQQQLLQQQLQHQRQQQLLLQQQQQQQQLLQQQQLNRQQQPSEQQKLPQQRQHQFQQHLDLQMQHQQQAMLLQQHEHAHQVAASPERQVVHQGIGKFGMDPRERSPHEVPSLNPASAVPATPAAARPDASSELHGAATNPRASGAVANPPADQPVAEADRFLSEAAAPTSDQQLRDLMAWAQAPRGSSILDLSSSCSMGPKDGARSGLDGDPLDAATEFGVAGGGACPMPIADCGGGEGNGSGLFSEAMPSHIGSKSSSGIGGDAGRGSPKLDGTVLESDPAGRKIDGSPEQVDGHAAQAAGNIEAAPAAAARDINMPPRPAYPCKPGVQADCKGAGALFQQQPTHGGTTERSMTQPSLTGSSIEAPAHDSARSPSWKSDGATPCGAAAQPPPNLQVQPGPSVDFTQAFRPFGGSDQSPIKPFGAAAALGQDNAGGCQSSQGTLQADIEAPAPQPSLPHADAPAGPAKKALETQANRQVDEPSSLPQRSRCEIGETSLKLESSGEPDLDAWIPSARDRMDTAPDQFGLSFTFNASEQSPAPGGPSATASSAALSEAGPGGQQPPKPTSSSPAQETQFRGGIAAAIAARNSSRPGSRRDSDAGSGDGSAGAAEFRNSSDVGHRAPLIPPASVAPKANVVPPSQGQPPLSASAAPFQQSSKQPSNLGIGGGTKSSASKRLSAELGLSDSDDDDVLKESLEPPSESGSATLSLSLTPGKRQVNPLSRQSAGRGLRVGLFQDSAGAGATPAPGGALAAGAVSMAAPSAKAKPVAAPATASTAKAKAKSGGAAQPKPWSTSPSWAVGGAASDDDDEEELLSSIRPKAKPGGSALSGLGLGSLRLGGGGTGRGRGNGRGGGGLGAAIDWNQANDPRW